MINIIDKLWNYLNGYAIISIEGFNKMKLINNAVKKFIRFSDITSDKIKSTAIIPIEDLKKLIHDTIWNKPISHKFGHASEEQDIELKNMVQIGG